MTAIRDYEQTLAREMLKVLQGQWRVDLRHRDEARLGEPRADDLLQHPRHHAAGRRRARWTAPSIGIRDGHMYAPRLMKRLGLSMDTGCLRVSLVHYNTLEEIARFGKVLAKTVASMMSGTSRCHPGRAKREPRTLAATSGELGLRVGRLRAARG